MKLKNLKPNEKNPRKISAKQREMLAKALEEFGDLSGFVFNRRTKQLAGGHQRQTVMPPDCEITIEKKYSKPTRAGTVATGFVEWKGERYTYREIDVDSNTEMAMNLAANKHGGEFELNLLNDTLLQLDAVHFDLDLTGFDKSDLIGLRPGKSTSGEDDVPEPRPRGEAKTKKGQIWALGKHRLMCGDSLNSSDLDSLLYGRKIDMVFTDPPYGINEETDRDFASRTRKAKGNKFAKIIGDQSIDTAVMGFSIASGLSPIVCYWGGNYYAHKMPASPCWLIWDKRVEENQRDMNSDCELAYVKHPTKKSVRIFRHLWKGMIKGSENGQGRVHPTQKPIALAEWCFQELAPKAESILDLFGGSGSTMIACEKTERTCFMMELDPVYCDVIIARFEKFTGKKAKLISPVKTILRKA